MRIDLPPAPRPWDGDPAAMAQAVAAGGGYAVVAFKEPGSARALGTGNRSAVTAGTVRAGLALLERHGVEVLDLLDGMGAARVRMSPQAAVQLFAHPLVDFVEPRRYLSLQAQTTQWGVNMVGAPSFWSSYGSSGSGAKILVIDTGHQQNHADLPAVPTANCAGLYGGCDDSSTIGWHGTHVLGIITARDNTIGVVGVAPGIAGSDVFVYGACDNNGSCPNDEVTKGINAGISNVDVINLSLSGTAYDAGMATAVAQAWSSGIVIVAAAGNDLSGVSSVYPAAYSNVVGVAGVNRDSTFAGSGTTNCGGFSNYGSHVDLAAPFKAYSTIGGNTYDVLCGTSMATPHVTGVAALLRSRHPNWTNQQIVDNMFASALDRGAAGRDDYYGHGIVRAIDPPQGTVSGPTSITTAGTYTWTASATGGDGSYTYTWRYRVQGTSTWSTVGSGTSYSRSVTLADADFDVLAVVTSAGVKSYAMVRVDVAPFQ
ncbi:MAG TPA: S8 family serine peptidase [Longimicrobium sp.]